MEKTPVESSVGKGNNRYLMILVGCAFGMAGIVALWYLSLSRGQIYVEKSVIEAPAIGLAAPTGGVLQQVFVQTGDVVAQNQPIAQVGGVIVSAREAGMIISVRDMLGKQFAPSEAVATMIRPTDLRVGAHVEEDKGLSDIRVGQRVTFAVDAFGSKTYAGIVDEVGQTARSGDVVFNISSARQEQEFDVKIRFDTGAYPELRNGMSAKTWIYRD